MKKKINDKQIFIFVFPTLLSRIQISKFKKTLRRAVNVIEHDHWDFANAIEECFFLFGIIF